MCGIGVTSRIDFTSRPAVDSARIADSRPEPGPFTSTSHDRMPNVLAALVAVSAAWVAAKGVGMRSIEVRVKGPGAGRESAVRALSNVGLDVKTIRDVTPIPHNGCRPPKKRRV